MARQAIGARKLDVHTAPERLPPTTARQLRNVTLRQQRLALAPGCVRTQEGGTSIAGVASAVTANADWIAPDGSHLLVTAFQSGLVRSWKSPLPEYVEADY